MKRTEDVNELREYVREIWNAYETVFHLSGSTQMGEKFNYFHFAIDEIDECASPYEDEACNLALTIDDVIEDCIKTMKWRNRPYSERTYFDTYEDAIYQDAKVSETIYRLLRRLVSKNVLDEHPALREARQEAVKIWCDIDERRAERKAKPASYMTF